MLKQIILVGLLLVLAGTSGAVKEVKTIIHTDHLGSPVIGRSMDGETVWERHYAPYGAQDPAPEDPLSPGYTGHLEERDSGLVYAGARWYDPRIGRFLSPDPVGFSVSNPVSFNRYAYANNNPFSYIDPLGMEAEITREVGGEIYQFTAYERHELCASSNRGCNSGIASSSGHMKMERFDEGSQIYYASSYNPQVKAYMDALHAASGESMMTAASVGSVAQPEAAPLWALMMAGGAGMVLIYGDDQQKMSAVASAAAGKAGAEVTKYFLRSSARPVLDVNKVRIENSAGFIMGNMSGSAIDE